MPHWGAGSATHGTAQVTNASGTVLAASNTCFYRRIQNVGAGEVYLSFAGGADAVAAKGVCLAGMGTATSVIEMNATLGNLSRGAITGIRGGAQNGTVLTTEW